MDGFAEPVYVPCMSRTIYLAHAMVCSPLPWLPCSVLLCPAHLVFSGRRTGFV